MKGDTITHIGEEGHGSRGHAQRLHRLIWAEVVIDGNYHTSTDWEGSATSPSMHMARLRIRMIPGVHDNSGRYHACLSIIMGGGGGGKRAGSEE